MSVRKTLATGFVLILFFQLSAQIPKNIEVNVKGIPLSQVLLDLQEKYGFQFAFDNDLLSKYAVTANKSFQTEEETIQFLIGRFPLEFEKSGDVFLIFPEKEVLTQQKPELKKTFISGQVIEAQTYEPLPFSYIIINEKFVQSDQQGNFSYMASADTSFNLRISHLGYFIYDTIFTGSLNRKFHLIPRMKEIPEIKVKGSPVEKTTLIGDKPGKIKLNHRIAPVIPGYGDNSVFNLLRLMPGVLASGEQSSDLLIWGSYESHSKIQFDGFTVFGLKNFNDNISVVNPFIVKNIEIYKGGYEARYGDRVGGIVDVTGKNGNLQKPAFTFNINNTTLNGLLEVPLSKKSSVLAAYRQTYYQLYDPTILNLFRKKNNEPGFGLSDGIDFTVVPNYNFRDANFKYTLTGDKGNLFSLSFYGGGDKFLYNMDGDYFKTHIKRVEEENNGQLGSSFFVSYPWENGSLLKFSGSYSIFEKNAFEQNETENTRTGRKKITKNISSENNVDEVTVQVEQDFPLGNGNKLIAGGGFIDNHVQLYRKNFDTEIIKLNTQSPRVYTFLQGEFPVTGFFNIKSGVRLVYSGQTKKWYPEPRFAASLNITEGLKVNASWGLFNQFLAKTSVVDSSFNFSYFWANSDGISIQVLHAQHRVAGISYNKNGFTFSTEGYYKITNGINRFYNGYKRMSRGFYQGEGRSYGLDFYLKKEYKNNMAWISYTLSRTEEHYPFFLKEYWKLAPHHQTHELKLAAIINFGSFYFSTNFVYGSGFERYSIETDDGIRLDQDYKRLDAALVYKLPLNRLKCEVGVSVLNVLNTENIKYSNLRRATVDEISLVGIYAEAVPFTPAIFLKIEL